MGKDNGLDGPTGPTVDSVQQRRAADAQRKLSAARHAVIVNNLLVRLCDEQGVGIHLSKRVLSEVCLNYVKEVEKIHFHQGDDISATKRIVALAFWVRRLKPIYFAFSKKSNTEICDINEKVAIWVATSLLVDNRKNEYMPGHFRDIKLKDIWGEFFDYVSAYWEMGNYCNYRSLVYAMRNRNISPHHLALYFDSLISGFTLKHTMILPSTSNSSAPTTS